jgi:hypothetical protein
MSNSNHKSAHVSAVAEIIATKSGDRMNTKLLHGASGNSPIPAEGMGTDSCLPAGQFHAPGRCHGGLGGKKRPATSGRRLVTDFIVLLADGWYRRYFPFALAMLTAAGAEITDACAETGIVEGVIASADLDALSRLPCVDRVTQVLTYISEDRRQVAAASPQHRTATQEK